MKKNNTINGDRFYLTHKIEFIPDKYAEEILIKNCEYRHFLYNKAVEKIKKDSIDGRLIFNKYELLNFIRHTYELDNPKDRPEFLEEYDYYFRGISEQVVSDICESGKRIFTNRKNGKEADLHFRKYNQNNQSFTICNKHPIPISHSRLVYDPNNGHMLGIKINKYHHFPLGITLLENLNKFIFKGMELTKIKEIIFKFHNDRWYIYLVEDCTDRLEGFKLLTPKKRSKLAGIDVGEINPVVIYNGKKIVNIPSHLKYPKDKIDRVNKRIQRLQSALDKKYQKGLSRNDQSNNYKKVLKKFHKACDHLINIKRDWHNKLAHWIVTHYENIIVDNFKDHIIKINEDMISMIRKRMNFRMYSRNMNHFMETLKYMSIKYDVNYYEALPNTTNTCYYCGNINKFKLSIDDRIFVCEACKKSIDRDINASINCFNQYKLLKTL